MADMFRVEILATRPFGGVDEMLSDALAKRAFRSVPMYYTLQQREDAKAPPAPKKTRTAAELYGPMVAYARAGGAWGERARGAHHFSSAIIGHLAFPERFENPFPILEITYRVSELHPDAKLVRLSGDGFVALSLLGRTGQPNPIVDAVGDERLLFPRALVASPTETPILVYGTSAEPTRAQDRGVRYRQLELTSYAVAKWVPHVRVGEYWDTPAVI